MGSVPFDSHATARAVGSARLGLEAANASLEKTALALDERMLEAEKDIDRAFAGGEGECQIQGSGTVQARF